MAQNPISTIDTADASIAAEAATKGDLSKLSPEQRTQLYGAVCKSMGLNPLSRPFEFITLNSKLTLYATRTATDQLRKINGVSISDIEQTVDDGVLTVTVRASDASGRTDVEIGAVSIGGLKGEALANARMKALTKAKRRVTLSISGLGWLDESEVSSVPLAATVTVDASTGEIGEPAPLQIYAPADTTRAMRVLHAEAKRHGITHEALHAWAESRGYGSLKNASADDLDGLTNAFKIDRNADRFLAKYQIAIAAAPAPEFEVMDDDDPLAADADTQAELINDPELHASADAVAAHYRQ